ncbi:MAG: hypothetical protein QMD06_02465 [Candidatus Altarchaeum sp.]|nr:hypothetical protein [Candidatus Altarchaeum sp.]
MVYTVMADNDKLLKFSNNKVMKKEELSKLFNCSGRTVQRKLKEWKAIRSYNNNGQYYALESIVKFDISGLWCYNSVCFSKYGNLSKTIISFVNESSNGMTASEISDTLCLEKKSFLTFFKNISKIRREKISSSYVYFSIDEVVYQRQKSNRINEEFSKSRLTDISIIHILTEKIKYPEFDEVAISKNLMKQGTKVNPISIIELFKRLGIEKKTTDFK